MLNAIRRYHVEVLDAVERADRRLDNHPPLGCGMPPLLYPGTANLEALEGAENYNRYLADLAGRAGTGMHSAIDFGAGRGTLARALQQRGFDVACVEPAAELRREIIARGLTASEDITELDPVDLIVCINVLEHLEDDVDTLRRLHSKLRPDGRLLLYVPAFPILYSAMDRFVGHCRRYRRGQLVQRVESCGFEILDACYADSLGFFAALLYKWMGGKQGRLSPRSVRVYDRILFPISRICDRLGLSRVLGKNVVVIARRSDAPAGGTAAASVPNR